MKTIEIKKDAYETFISSWYYERHVEPLTKTLHFSVEQRLGELEHPVLVTEWIHSMDTAAYICQSQKEDVPSRNKNQ